MYLDKLRVFHKNATPQTPLFEGQLVLIDSLFKRSKFRLGVVTKVRKNRSDDQVRTVSLRVNTDHGVDKWEAWPAARVIPLEVERPLPVLQDGERTPGDEVDETTESKEDDLDDNLENEDQEGEPT